MKLLIIGTGLIGGSLGLALKDSPLINYIYGYEPDQEALQTALAIGAIDEAVDLKTGAALADIIFLSTPLSFFAPIIAEISPTLRPGTIVTDVGSTKEEVMKIFKNLPPGVWGIGGHPMAGSEIKGINGADRYLFENAVYGLTPGKEPPEVLEKLIEVITATGAKIKILDAVLHDELVATVSHLPHLVAVALVNLTAGEEDYLSMAAGGFRDTTRIASSNPQMWEDILLFNRTHILNKLDQLMDIFTDIKNTIKTEDNQKLQEILNQAKEIRDTIPRARKGIMPSYHDIVCIVPDEPGIIGRLGYILATENINIVDIEILRVREGDGGTIRIGLPSDIQASGAVELLQKHKIKAWIR